VIRPLYPDDVPACAALLDRLPDWFGLAESNAAYVAALAHAPGFVAVDARQVVGFLALERHGPRSAEILVMGVDPDRHRRGVGRRLVAAAIGWSVQHGVRWLHVKTRGPSTPDPAYERTRRFYRAVGFDDLYESRTEWGVENAALVLVLRVPDPEPVTAS
jgi:GNAT superfamily N-acetyltransferase